MFAFFPVNMKLIFLLSIVNPIKFLVRGFGSAMDNGVVDDANGTFVVESNWR